MAKTCAHGEKILLLSGERYALVQAAAKVADHRVLVRAIEIFAAAEGDCRYASAPKITLETAVLKASMAREDTDISALVLRIEALEKALKNVAAYGGDAQVGEQVGAQTSASPINDTAKSSTGKFSAAPHREERVKQDEAGEFPTIAPPDEEETGGNIYFDADYIRSERKKEAQEQLPSSAAVAFGGTKSAAQTVGAAANVSADAKVMFGRFLRALRSNSNGVLFTICMDMESAFENGTFVLYTTKETLLNTLKRETNYPVVQKALAQIGISDFDIRLKEKEKDETNRAIDEIKERFSDVKIEVKP